MSQSFAFTHLSIKYRYYDSVQFDSSIYNSDVSDVQCHSFDGAKMMPIEAAQHSTHFSVIFTFNMLMICKIKNR